MCPSAETISCLQCNILYSSVLLIQNCPEECRFKFPLSCFKERDIFSILFILQYDSRSFHIACERIHWMLATAEKIPSLQCYVSLQQCCAKTALPGEVGSYTSTFVFERMRYLSATPSRGLIFTVLTYCKRKNKRNVTNGWENAFHTLPCVSKAVFC